MTLDAELRLDSRCQLGEGISWIVDQGNPDGGAFFFVDIHAHEVHSVSLNGSGHRIWNLPERIGWLIPLASGDGYLAGMQSGFARLWLGSGIRFEWLNRIFKDRPELRLNDAKADCLGNVWAGSMNNDDESQSDGELFKLAPNGELTICDVGYCVPNGPAISHDLNLFLHTDSARRTIYSFEYDENSGLLSGKRVWHVFSEDEGFPDGMNFDVDGNVWVAHWGAGLVSCFSANGSLLHRLKLPVSNITNLSFGGLNLDRLFVATARSGLSAKQSVDEPLAGAIFEICGHGTKGFKPYAFGMHGT